MIMSPPTEERGSQQKAARAPIQVRPGQPMSRRVSKLAASFLGSERHLAFVMVSQGIFNGDITDEQISMVV